MKKTIKFLMLALVAMLACVSFSSCGGEDEPETPTLQNSYRLRLEKLETNCIENNKYTIDIWVLQDMIDKGYDIEFISGSDDQNAESMFKQFMNTVKTSCVDFYNKAGSLKEGDYVTYHYVMYNSLGGKDVATETFTVTKDGIK